MGHPLDGVEAKLNRGHKHLNELHRKVRAFFAGESYHIALEPDPEPRYHRGIFRIDREPPIELGIIAGEALGQYRSALDHLMHQLTALRKPGSGENFPICPKPGQFWEPPKPGAETPYTRVRRTVRPEHFAILESLQPRKSQPTPYTPNRLHEHRALGILQTFTNEDKHELVRAGFLAPQSFGTSLDPNVADFDWIIEPSNYLRDEAKLYRIKFVDESNMDVPFRLEANLNFGDGTYEWIAETTIRQCEWRCREIVKRFRAVTPEFS